MKFYVYCQHKEKIFRIKGAFNFIQNNVWICESYYKLSVVLEKLSFCMTPFEATIISFNLLHVMETATQKSFLHWLNIFVLLLFQNAKFLVKCILSFFVLLQKECIMNGLYMTQSQVLKFELKKYFGTYPRLVKLILKTKCTVK